MTEQQVRELTVIRPGSRTEQGEPVKVIIETPETDWGIIRDKLFPEFGIYYNESTTKAITIPGRTELTMNTSQVGSKIYLYAKDTKAGMDRSEMYDLIKEHVKEFGKNANDYYNRNRHYTNTSNDDLAKLIANSPYNGPVEGVVDEDWYKAEIDMLRKKVSELEVKLQNVTTPQSFKRDPDLEEYYDIKSKI